MKHSTVCVGCVQAVVSREAAGEVFRLDMFSCFMKTFRSVLP